MIQVVNGQFGAAARIFGDWQETIIWSCLQNVMGHVYVNDTARPVSAMALLGDFCFFAGIPDGKLVSSKPPDCGQDFMIMVPQNDEWGALIEACYEGKAKKVVRYAFRKEKDVFDKNILKAAAAGLPGGYSIKQIDEALFMECKKTAWCRDFVSQYENYGAYQDHGLGVVIQKGHEIVSGASSYSGYRNGIEIEVDTREDCRRKGLAYISAAKLILLCLERGWYPGWDAQNQWSAALAKKLGYRYSHAYTAYEIWGY